MRQKILSLYKTLRLLILLSISYIKANWRLFFVSLTFGLLLLAFFPRLVTFEKNPVIGLTGDYTISTLPLEIQNQISFGLTRLLPDGSVASAAAKSWKITDSGKTITFDLDTSLHWQSGEKFNADSVNYNLKSVQLTRPTPDQIKLSLKEPFAPLLTIVSQPLFKNGLVGLGTWRVDGINFSGRFVSQVSLTDTSSGKKQSYKFFPTEQSLITALKLGTVSVARGLHATYGLQTDKHYQITSTVATSIIATLFFDLQKDLLEDKTFRQALTYALPDEFSEGTHADAPVVPKNWSESDMIKKYPQSLDLAKKLLSKTTASSEGKLKLQLATLAPLEDTAKKVASAWKELGIDVDTQIFDVPPPNYDVFLTFINLPTEPDQYFLWHSTQIGNIAHYKSPKVDKLLEEGRKSMDTKERKNIYANFQRTITEDVPAAFLFYPKLYTVKKI